MHSWKLLSFFSLSQLIIAGTAVAEADSLSDRVAAASARIDAAISQVRRTGNLAEVLPELDAARQELDSAHNELLKSQRRDEASFAILRAGDCCGSPIEPPKPLRAISRHSRSCVSQETRN